MKKSKGFTLIELLVVISIIGILVAVGTVSYQRTNKLSRDSRRKADLEQIRQALESYRAENGEYPVSTATLIPDFISNLPSDPKDGAYDYIPSGSPAYTYSLCANLEMNADVTAPGCGSASCGTGLFCNYEVTNP